MRDDGSDVGVAVQSAFLSASNQLGLLVEPGGGSCVMPPAPPAPVPVPAFPVPAAPVPVVLADPGPPEIDPTPEHATLVPARIASVPATPRERLRRERT